MDIWTIFGAFKLFLDIIDGGPSAVVKGVLMMGVPYSYVLDIGEVAYGLFDMGGNYCGEVVLNNSQYVPISSLTLLNKEDLMQATSELNFPRLAELEFAKIRKREFPQF